MSSNRVPEAQVPVLAATDPYYISHGAETNEGIRTFFDYEAHLFPCGAIKHTSL